MTAASPASPIDDRYWHDRWAGRQIGFHQPTPTPLLLKHWPSLGVAAGAKVFVPLAGKSNDLAWLASQGHRVLGVELSQLAIDQFFAEHGLAPEAGVRAWQERLNPLWRKFTGGCNLNRKLDDLIRLAGFTIAHLETAYAKGLRPMSYIYSGRARV